MPVAIKNFATCIAAFILFISSFSSVHSQELSAGQQEAIHKELRGVRDTAIKAIQDRDLDALLALFSDDVSFTAMNNEVVYGLDGARLYYDRMIKGSASIVEDMSFDLESDKLSRIYNNGTATVSTGVSIAYFKIRGGAEFTVPLRWTASMTNKAGKWQITSVHFSANIFDNPVSGGFLKYFWWILAAVAIVFAALGFLLGKRRSKAT